MSETISNFTPQTLPFAKPGFYLSDGGEWIPDGWTETTLGTVVSLSDGTISTGPFGSALHAEDYVTDGIPSIMPQNIINWRISEEGVARITEQDAERLSKHRVSIGDIVFSRRGDIEKCALISPKEKGWLCGTGCLQISFGKTEHFVEFLFNQLKWTKTSVWLYANAVGATMPNLNTGVLKRLPVVLPPVAEQKAIAAVLGSLDDKIELLREQNETLEALAQTLFKRWFIDFNFPDENGNPYKDSGGKMIASEFGEIPEGWIADKLDGYISISGGGTPSTKEPSYWDGEIAWSSPKDLSDRPYPFLFETNKTITDEGLHAISSGLNPVGSLLLSSRAPIGYIAFADVPVAVNQGYIVFAPEQRLSNQFMFLWLKKNMNVVTNAANGSTFLEISKKAFKEIETVIPNETVLGNFQKLIMPHFEKLRNNLLQIKTLTQLRDTLLPKLMKGEIRIKADNF